MQRSFIRTEIYCLLNDLVYTVKQKAKTYKELIETYRQPPRSQNIYITPWKLSNLLKQMSTPREYSRSGKGIDPRFRKQKIPDAGMVLGALGELQMQSRGVGQSHTSFLSPVPPSKWDTRYGGSR